MMRAVVLALLLLTAPARAEFVLQLPLGAKEVYSQLEPDLPPRVPIAPFADGQVPKVATPETIRRTVWQLGGEQTVRSVVRAVLTQLETRGYEVLLDCVASACGGFDFRFGIDVVPEPEMWVDLRRFRFITARQSVSDNPGFVTFLISRSPVAVFVQMTEYVPEPAALATVDSADDKEPPAARPTGGISVVLEGLEFDVGSTGISADPQGAIAALAERLRAEPTLNVLLVGHSDMSGTLDGNIAVSRGRAEAVRQALIRDHGIDAARLSAHGVGFLAPRASNDTDEGRQKNRRVEAVFSR